MAADPQLLAALRASVAAIEYSRQPSSPLPSPENDEGAAEKEGERSFGEQVDEAYQKILRSLSVREQSTHRMREKLLRADISPEAAEAALEKAVGSRIIDDTRYAEALVRSTLAAGKGLRLVEKELGELGVVLDELEAYQDHCSTDAESDLDRAMALLQRHPPRAKNKREAAYRKLVSKGYTSDVAVQASRLWSEDQGL